MDTFSNVAVGWDGSCKNVARSGPLMWPLIRNNSRCVLRIRREISYGHEEPDPARQKRKFHLVMEPMIFRGSIMGSVMEPTKFTGSIMELVMEPIKFTGSIMDLVMEPIDFTGSIMDLVMPP